MDLQVEGIDCNNKNLILGLNSRGLKPYLNNHHKGVLNVFIAMDHIWEKIVQDCLKMEGATNVTSQGI